MATAILPDGSKRDLPDGSTVYQLAESIGRGLAKAALIGRVDGKPVDLSHPLTGEHHVSIVTDKDPEGLAVLRHSTAHVLAQALRRLYGDGVQYTIGPVIDNGFYYDFEFPAGVKITADDLPKVEKEMEAIIAADYKFGREDVQPEDARQRLHGRGQRFKKELIDELEKSGESTVSLYEQGDFLDLCRGPHLPGTGKIKAFKLMSIAGAYWRGDQAREQLTRIYGTAFFDKKQLEQHQQMLEEAKKRDHRVIGPALGLYTIDDQVGQGLVLWKPKGAIVRQELQNFIGQHLKRQGYSQVFTPHIGRLGLYKTSGHFPYYRESQFPPLVDREFVAKLADEKCNCSDLSNLMDTGEIDGYLLKPMNCPMHIRIYASEPHSYRDLPIRLAEFGTVYRWEKSGELGGMTRVRGFTQDDAHLFCTPEQVAGELLGCLELVKIVLGTLGMNDYRVRVGLRDPDSAKFVGDASAWDAAEAACISAAETLGVPFTKEPGEAAFYGPKIDFVVRDVIGPRVAARYGAGRLPTAATVRPDVRRGRQPPAPAGDDPPRPVRQYGAVHRRADRTLRRRVPAVAGPGAGGGADGEREVGRVREAIDSAAQRRRPAGGTARQRQQDRRENPPRADGENAAAADRRREGSRDGNGERAAVFRRRRGDQGFDGGRRLRRRGDGESRCEVAPESIRGDVTDGGMFGNARRRNVSRGFFGAESATYVAASCRLLRAVVTAVWFY